MITHDRPQKLKATLDFLCSLASQGGHAVLVSYTASTVAQSREYQELQQDFPEVIFAEGSKGIVQNRLALEKLAHRQGLSFLYCFDDDVTSLSISLGSFGGGNALGNNYGNTDLDLLSWFLGVLARSCDFVGAQPTRNKGFGRLVATDLAPEIIYCQGGCFGHLANMFGQLLRCT